MENATGHIEIKKIKGNLYAYYTLNIWDKTTKKEIKKSYPPWVKRNIEIPNISIYAAFSNSAKKYKNNIAIDFMGSRGGNKQDSWNKKQ